MKLKIEVMFLEGCPNHPPTLDRVRHALDAEHLTADVREVEVRDAADAQAAGFLGSPTVRVNGLDIEADARGAQSYGFGCRTYIEQASRSGVPSVALIRAALAEAATAPTRERERS